MFKFLLITRIGRNKLQKLILPADKDIRYRPSRSDSIFKNRNFVITVESFSFHEDIRQKRISKDESSTLQG